MSKARYFGSACVGAVMTLIVFYFMFSLIARAEGRPVPGKAIPSITFSDMKKLDEIPEKIREEPPPKPKPQQPPPPQPKPEFTEKPPLDLVRPDFDLPKGLNNSRDQVYVPPPLDGYADQGNGELTRLVYVAPNFPPEAAIKGLEGWVRITFTVGIDGRVTQPRVLEAYPSPIFNREAIRAVLKWKFKPQVVGGQARERRVEQRIDFTLPDA